MASNSKKQKVMAEIERLTAQADELPEGEERQQIVAQIAVHNAEYQADD
jgi:hypothetical protein